MTRGPPSPAVCEFVVRHLGGRGAMLVFHASRVSWSDDHGCSIVTLDEGGEGAEYLVFQRARDAPGGDGVYVERRGQNRAARGGVLRCHLHRNCLFLTVAESTARRLGGESEFEVRFELSAPQFRGLRSRLGKVFHGSAGYADRSAGERLVRRPRDGFVESLARTFRGWFGRPPGPTDGCSRGLIREGEEYNGFPFPGPLRTYFLHVGENKVLGLTRGLVLTPEAVEVEGGRLIFWMGHEADREGAWCGVRLEDLDHPDPPVERQLFLSEDEAVWVPECRRLSWFLLRTMCWQAVWGLPARSVAAVGTREARERLTSLLTLVAPAEPLEAEFVGYAGDGLAACVLPGDGSIRVGARTDERLRWLEQASGVTLRLPEAEPGAEPDR